MIIETISSVNVKAETRQEAEKQIMEELSTAPNIVSKQILSVSRIRRKPQNDSAKQGKKDTIIFGSSIVRRGTVMRSGLNNTIKPAYNNNAAEKAAIKIENPYSIISLLYAL